MFWILNCLPIFIHLLLLPFWYFEKNPGTVSLIEIVLGSLIIPLYLIIMNSKFINKINMQKFIIILLLMMFISIIGNLIAYFNWGIVTGNLFHPDSETVHIIKLQMLVSIIVIFIGWIITFFIKRKFN